MSHRLILHIGIHKTCTTLIQSYLYEWRHFLRSASINIPYVEPPFQHQAVLPWVGSDASSVSRFYSPNILWDKMAHEASSYSLSIISSEELSQVYPNIINYAEIRDMALSHGEFSVYLSIRPIFDLISSIYITVRGDKVFDPQDFDSYFDKILAEGHAFGVPILYDQFLANIIEQISPSRVTLIPYALLTNKKSNPAWSFLMNTEAAECILDKHNECRPYSLPVDPLNVNTLVSNYLLCSRLYEALEKEGIPFGLFLDKLIQVSDKSTSKHSLMTYKQAVSLRPLLVKVHLGLLRLGLSDDSGFLSYDYDLSHCIFRDQA